MRDGTLIAEFTKLSRRTVMLYDQMEEIHLRQEAREKVESGSTIWQRVVWFFKPNDFLQLVDLVQLRMHDITRAKRAEAMAEAKVKDKIKIAPASILKP